MLKLAVAIGGHVLFREFRREDNLKETAKETHLTDDRVTTEYFALE